MTFSFARTPKILFGPGKLELLPEITEGYGRRILLITGRSSFYKSTRWPLLTDRLSTRKIVWDHYVIPCEPAPSLIDECVLHRGFSQPDVIVAIGGGSVLDAGKAISAMWFLREPVKPYLEGVGDGRVHDGRKIPFIAVPTTSGTGSEATKNAVISEIGERGFKKSLRHDQFVPDLALVDPELTLNCPPHITAWSGMDAFTQLLESYLSTQANPFTDAIAESGLNRIVKSLETTVIYGNDLEARTDMAYAALCSGITLANAGLGTVHGFASSIGGRFVIPHGLLCGSLMGIANDVTVTALRKMDPDSASLAKFAEIGRKFHHSKDRSINFYVDFLVNHIYSLIDKFNIPKLSDYGISKQAIPNIVSDTSSKNNPVQHSKDELIKILEERI